MKSVWFYFRRSGVCKGGFRVLSWFSFVLQGFSTVTGQRLVSRVWLPLKVQKFENRLVCGQLELVALV
jgi:hypothetical protein